MAKAEISWTRINEEGQKLQCYAQHVGKKWIFHSRFRRFDQWQEIETPPLEDWLELLDCVQRRVARMLLPPDAEIQVKRMILERFPSHKF
ncbi:MAG: hypothetical protein JWM68_4289 [Verrucomicrobiales bacterium]|nr:hypothetical protein [Verrucomicrobiales bacterium]